AQEHAELHRVLLGELEQGAHLVWRRWIDLLLACLRQCRVTSGVRRDPTPLHRLAERAPQHGMELPDRTRSEAFVPRQSQVVRVEVRGGQRVESLPAEVRLQSLLDETLVLTCGRGGEVRALVLPPF